MVVIYEATGIIIIYLTRLDNKKENLLLMEDFII